MNDTKQAQQMINSALSLYQAKIKAGQANALNEIQPILIDLSEKRDKNNAQKISFPFKSVRVSQATDLDTFINLVPEDNSEGRGSTRLGLLDSLNTEYGFNSCYLFWDAQPNKKVLLEFYTTSNISNGRLLLDQNSDVDNLNIGSSILQRNSYLQVVQFTSSGQSGINCSMSALRSTLGNLANSQFWQVPSGYTAEVVACEVALQSLGAANNLFLYHTTVTTGDIANGGRIVLNPSHPQTAISVPTLYSTKVFPRRINGVHFAPNTFYDENEEIYIRYNNISTVVFDAFVAFKLTPKVG